MLANKGSFNSWLKFNFVGLIGIVVQLGLLKILTTLLSINYLLATVCAVEMTILHNFIWHQYWTWRDREIKGNNQLLTRLFRFHLSNGMVSIVGNLLIMKIIVECFGLRYTVANLIAISICALVNYFLANSFVFRTQAHV